MRNRATLRPALLVLILFPIAVGSLWSQTPYWETPSQLITQRVGSSSAVAAGSFMVVAWQDIKPRSATDKTSGTITLSLAVSHDGITWTKHASFFGPIPYAGVTEGNEPRIYSMTVDAQDRIMVAVAASDRETVILQSTDQGATFQQAQRLTSATSTVVPNIFAMGKGGFVLLLSQGTSGTTAEGISSLIYSFSRDGKTWSALSPFVTSADKTSSPQLQPAAAFFQGRDYVIFEALTPRSGNTNTWQLYLKSSGDSGMTWDTAVPITSIQAFGKDSLDYNNERPRLTTVGTQLALVWERSAFGAERPQIWTARLDAKGSVVGAPEIVTNSAPSRFAQVVVNHGTSFVVFVDGSGANSRIILAEKVKTWETQPLLNTGVQSAVFPQALVFKGSMYMFWENQAQIGITSSIVELRPLTSVGEPIVRPVDFTPGVPANRDSVTVSWTEPVPADPSGIREYRYWWTYTSAAGSVEVERQTVSGLSTQGKPLTTTRKTDKDGVWSFSVLAVDLAGNISPTPASVSFARDATPPQPISFQVLGQGGTVVLSAPAAAPEKRDANSFVIDTNTFTLRWVPGGDTDIVGYTYNLQQGWTNLDEYKKSSVPLLGPPSRVVTTTTERPFVNEDNGVYALTVRAIDKAGNFSAPSTIALALANYQVVTRIDFVTTQKDPILGNVSLTINGRGFIENGPIRKLYLYRGQAKPPYDIELDPIAPLRITDRQISGIVLDQNRESGSYKIGLVQDRPTGQTVPYYTPAAMFTFQSPGTVKVGNFQIQLPSWIIGQNPQYIFSFDALLVVLIVALLGVLSFLAVRKIVALAQEGAAVRSEVLALLEGRPNVQWEERKKRMQVLNKRGMGLRFKFTLLIVILVIMIVLIVSLPLGFQMVNRERQTSGTDLQKSADILLGALVTSAETQIRLLDAGFEGAADIPSLITTMKEAVTTTVTGPKFVIGGPNPDAGPTVVKDFVWASDEDKFLAEQKAGNFDIAAEKVGDDLANGRVGALQKQIDADGMAKLGSLVTEYRALYGQQQDLQNKTDAASRKALAMVSPQVSDKRKAIDVEAKALFARSYAIPEFNAGARLQPSYLFYEPIIFYNKATNLADTSFYQGMVRLRVDATGINKQIDDGIREILRTASTIALIAIVLGVLGAIIMANITITPIRKLSRGVAIIRDTEDKEQLRDHTIDVGTRDEIGLLAETVNEMTKGLVKAAAANKELLLGKDVQKMFLPLDKDADNRKGTTAGEDNKEVEIYGYYEGAKGVSGDYFDFKKLDKNHYAFIKCDVAGKGVPAALIMVEVATLFISYFRDWEKRQQNIASIKDPKAKQRAVQELERIDTLVYTINDMLEERGFKGRFAALTIVLFNSETGVANVCNAGDNLMHIFEARTKKMIAVKLPDSPAAGVFPSMLVEMKSGFRQIPHRLDVGDALFMFTDGFEEAKRSFRNATGEIVPCEAPDVKEGEPHGETHSRGQTSEEFGTPRIEAIVAATFSRSHYTLVRSHVMDEDEHLEFDFSSCAGTVKDAVLALVAVEKVFRMIPHNDGDTSGRIVVEAKVDAFLKEHFLGYGTYFSQRAENQPNASAITFAGLKEDEQYDDLTILVLRRK
jgi:HAMP domain-containing protein